MKKLLAEIITVITVLSSPSMAFNLKQSINNFAIRLFNTTNKTANVLISPYSIYIAFGPVYEGAAGKTAQEIKNGLGYPEKNRLRLEISREIKNKANSPINIFNRMYIDKHFTVLKTYQNIVRNYYHADIKSVDFSNKENRCKTAEKINSDVENATKGKIKNLIRPGDLNRLTRLINVNAVYFKDSWEKPFEPQETEKRPFFVGEKTIYVPTMTTTGYFNVYNSNNLKAITIPYKNGFKMTIIVPDNKFKLTPENYNFIKSRMKRKYIKLYLPKFKIKSRLYIKKNLSKLGVKIPFTPGANFKNIDGKKDLYIQKAIHQTFVNVDENGTEAAAATAVIIGLKCLPPGVEEIFKVNRPFIFTINDSNDTILFIGNVHRPEE
ncbi:serpin family protein [Desulfurobacterium sp.]